MKAAKWPVRWPVWAIRFAMKICRWLPAGSRFHRRLMFLSRRPAVSEALCETGGERSRLARADDLAEIMRRVSPPAAQAYLRRLEAGHKCFCIPSGERVAGYLWFNAEWICCQFGSDKQLLLEPLRDDGVYMYDLFVFAEYRRRGFAARLVADFLRWPGIQEAEGIYSCVEVRNKASRAFHRESGFTLRGTFDIYRFADDCEIDRKSAASEKETVHAR